MVQPAAVQTVRWVFRFLTGKSPKTARLFPDGSSAVIILKLDIDCVEGGDLSDTTQTNE